MSEVVQQGGAEGTPSPAPGQAGEGTPTPTPAVPEGYVPRAELEREQARARGFQSELSKAQAELSKLQAPAPTPTPTTGETSAPDVTTLIERGVSEAVSKVFRAGELRDAAATLKAEFPQVAAFEPGLFAADRLAGFESVESLRGYVEDVNGRLTKLLQPQQQLSDEEQRAAAAAAAAGSAGPSGATPPPAGDPTPEQLASMTLTQLDALEKASPGTIERVMAKQRAGAAA